MLKRYILSSNSPEAVKSCHGFIDNCIREHPHQIEVRIDEYDPKRTVDQNSRRWARMAWLEDCAQDSDGRRLRKESWHYKTLIETGYIAGSVPFKLGGVRIEVPVPASSAKMGRAEFAEMEDKTDALLATEYGVTIPEVSDG